MRPLELESALSIASESEFKVPMFKNGGTLWTGVMGMKRGTELRFGLRLLVMALVFLALSCEGSGGDGCGDCNMDALVTGCSDGCGQGCTISSSGSCLGDCMLGGDGCMGDCLGDCDMLDCGDVPNYVYPANGMVAENAIQVHVTGSLFNFVSANLPALLSTVAGDLITGNGTTFDICLEGPLLDEAGIKVCHRNYNCRTSGTGANNGCKVTVGLANNGLVITPISNGNGTKGIRVRVNIGTLSSSMGSSTLWGVNNCTLTLSKGSGSVYAQMNAYFNISRLAGAPHTEIYVGDLDVNIDGVSVSGCGLGGLVNMLKGTIIDQVKGAIGGLTCRKCNTNTDCPGTATCNGDKICVYPSNDPLKATSNHCQAVQAGVDASIDVGAVLASMIPGAEGKLGMRAYLGGYADTIASSGSTSIQLGGRLGVQALQPSLCVPNRPAPIVAANNGSCRNGLSCGRLTELNSVSTINGQDFHVGLGIAMTGLNLALWSVYNSGLLCLSLDASSLMPDLLHTELLSGFVPSLGAATEGKKQALFVQLRPQQEPAIEFRHGEEGQAVLVVKLQNLEVDLYTFVHERHTRIATVTANLEVPLGIMASGTTLELALGDLTELLGPGSLAVSNGDVVEEAQLNTLLTTMLPSLIGGLGGELGSLIPPIEIPEIEGLKIQFVGPGIKVLNDPGTTIPAALGVFIKIGLGNAGGAETHVEPVVQDFTVDIKDPVALRAELTRAIRAGKAVSYLDYMPRVQVRVDAVGEGVVGKEAEYAYSVNGGLWSFWQDGPVITIDNPAIAMEGEHEVRIRARAKDEAATGSNVFETISFVNDFTRPVVALEALGGGVNIVASDNVYSADQLTMSYKVNGGPFSAAGPVGAIDLAPYLIAGEAVVEVHVFDPSGNVTAVRRTFGVAQDKSAAAPAAAADDVDGCASAQGNSGFLAILALLVLVAFRRRREQASNELVAASNPYMTLAMIFIVALGLGASGCKTSSKGIELCPNDCPSWQTCSEDTGYTCQASACLDDSACGSAGRCVNGFCEPATSCIDNFDCEVFGEVCIDGFCSPSQCEDTSDCSITCSGGQLPFCEYEEANGGGVCLCADPLATGNVGKYLTVVATADRSQAWALAYNSDFGDAVISRINDDGSFDWDFFDGVPTNAPVIAPPEGPRGGVRDAGPLAGPYIGAAVEESEAGIVIHAAYQYAPTRTSTDYTLRYARGVVNGDSIDWTMFDIKAADAGVGHDGIAGMYNNVIIDAVNGTLAIVSSNHRVLVNPEVAEDQPAAAQEYYSEVRYFFSETLTPASAEDFTVQAVVDQQEDPRPCAGLCDPIRTVCSAATNSCVPKSTNAACSECGDGQVCENQAGTPVCVPGADGAEGIAYVSPGVGLYTSALLVDTKIHVAYYDRVFGNLKYAVVDAPTGTVDSLVVLDGERLSGNQTVDTGDTGWWAKVVRASNGTIIVFYQDGSRGSLHAAVPAQNRTYLVDRGLYYDAADRRWVESNFVGASVQVVEGPEGLEIFYADATNHVVRKAVWTNLNAAPPTLTNAPIVWGNSNRSDAQIQAGTDAVVSFYLNVLRGPGVDIIASLGLRNRNGLKSEVTATVIRTEAPAEETP